MKRMIALLLPLLLLCGCCPAEVVGTTGDGLYILRHLTDGTEEELFYVSQLP